MTSLHIYEPNAVTKGGERLFTYNGELTLTACLKQFDLWSNIYLYDIAEAWIIERVDGECVNRIPVERTWVVKEQT